MMVTISPSDVILEYLYTQQKTTRTELMKELRLLFNRLAGEDIFAVIDFNFYQDRITSDVADSILWGFISSDIITRHQAERGSEVIYTMTEYGNRITDYLLKTFKESSEWDIYERVRSSTLTTRNEND